MFGPDKCCITDKVHFILRHKNPISGIYEEKHATGIINGVYDTTGLYTLIIRPDSTYEIRINNKPVKYGHLLKNMEPPINPPEGLLI